MHMAQKKHIIKLKSDLSELNTLCQDLENYGQNIGLSKKCIFEINLALDELFTLLWCERRVVGSPRSL